MSIGEKRNLKLFRNAHRILGVAIDPSKNFHRVSIFSFAGQIIYPSFSINTLRTGYLELKKKIRSSAKLISAKEVYIAVEQAGPYTISFLSALNKDFKNVVLVPPLAVAENRRQRLLPDLKTDDTDVSAIGDLLTRGQFRFYREEEEVYLRLRELIHWRFHKIKFIRTLKNQILARTEKLFPGINSQFGEYKKLFRHPFENLLFRGLLKIPQGTKAILKLKDKTLVQVFEHKHMGKAQVKKLKERLRLLLPVREEQTLLDLQLRDKDVQFFQSLESEIKKIDEEIIRLAKLTPAQFLFGQIKGISDLTASIYVGLIGDIKRYKTAGHVLSRAGLVPKIRLVDQ